MEAVYLVNDSKESVGIAPCPEPCVQVAALFAHQDSHYKVDIHNSTFRRAPWLLVGSGDKSKATLCN